MGIFLDLKFKVIQIQKFIWRSCHSAYIVRKFNYNSNGFLELQSIFFHWKT